MIVDGTGARSVPPAPFEPDVAAFLEVARVTGRPGFERMTVAQARDAYLAGRDTSQLSPIEIGTVSEDSFAGRTGHIPVRRYRPAATGPGLQPAIHFFHGGGWEIGDLDTHDSLCRHIVDATGLQLIAIHYRLAPEHVSPLRSRMRATPMRCCSIGPSDPWISDTWAADFGSTPLNRGCGFVPATAVAGPARPRGWTY